MNSQNSKTMKTQVGRPKDVVKRHDIVMAAHDLFMEKGYTLTSIEAVAKKANVSKLTIYSHFANKDALFKEVISERCLKVIGAESFLSMANEPVDKALLKLGLNFVSLIFTKDSIRMHSIMQAEAARHPQVIEIFFENGPKRVREEFGKLLQEWNAQKKLVIRDTVKATDQFFSLLKGEMLMSVMLLRRPMPSDAELKAHVKATVDFFLAAYLPIKK
jgi:TetR/AcrR family transcriptional repressor of mexJK operon